MKQWWRERALPGMGRLWHQYAALVAIGAALVGVFMLWARLTDPKESSSVISGGFGVMVGALVGLGVEFARRRLDQRQKLSALAQLLWADLGMATLRIERAPAEVSQEIDISLWKDIRIDLIQAGMPVPAVANLTVMYSIAEKWNLAQSWLETAKTQKELDDLLAELERLRQTMLGGVIKTATDLLRPYVPRDAQQKVYQAREAAPPPKTEEEPQA